MNPAYLAANRMMMPRISEEPDVPNEDNYIHQDGRLAPSGTSSQVRHYGPATTSTFTPGLQGQMYNQPPSVTDIGRPILEAPLSNSGIRGFENEYIPSTTSTQYENITIQPPSQQEIRQVSTTAPLNHESGVSFKDQREVFENLPAGGLPQSSTYQQGAQASGPIQKIVTSSGATIEGRVLREYVKPQEGLSQTTPITRKDEKAITQHLPAGGLPQDTVYQQGGLPQGGLPQDAIYQQGGLPQDAVYQQSGIPQDTIYQQDIQSPSSAQQVLASSGIPVQGQLPQGRVVQEYVESQEVIKQASPIVYKEEKTAIQNIPLGGITQTGIQSDISPSNMSGRVLQSGIYSPTSGIQGGIASPNFTSTSIIQPQGVAPTTHTEYHKETTVVTTQGPTGGLVQNSGMFIDNFSQINQVESQYMRDSSRLARTSQSPGQSRFDAQQFELSAMRHENHHNFENWEVNRNIFVNDRLNIMNDLLAGMERTNDWLDVGVNKVILFFKERESQELEYSKRVKHGLTQVGEHFVNAEHPEVLGNFSRGLKENDIFHAKETRNCEIMGMFIKKDILDWILIPAEKNYKTQAAALRVPLHTHKRKMDLLGSKRQRAYNKYFKLYDTIQRNAKPQKSDDSLFKRQLKYSLSAREELRMLRLYDEQGIFVINEFAKLNTLRMAEVQKAYSLYFQKYRELYQNTATAPEPIIALIDRSNGPESVPGLFTVKNLLSPPNYDFVRKTLGLPLEVTYPALVPFLVDYPDSIDPTRTSFVLKEWEAVKQGGFLKRTKPCNVIATTTNNLLIIEKKTEEAEMGKVKDPMQLRYTRVEDVTATEDGTVLKVVERAPGTIFHHTTRTRLKFETPNEAQQFMDFVNSQAAGEV